MALTAGPDPLQGLPYDGTPPADPGKILPPVHEQFGVQHFGGPTFPLAPDLSINLLYPVRPGTYIDMAQVMDHGVQMEADPGFLRDLMFYAGPGGLSTQFPSANLPFHLPLEGVTYSNVQIDEQEFLMRAEAQVRRALGGQ